jgi:hypothetical protein
MTLAEFEMHCHKVFSERLLTIRDAEDRKAKRLMRDLLTELELVALNTVEVCQRGAYLLVLACYDMHLGGNADVLGVPADYFDGDRPQESEALMYLHQRRCGAPARQFITVH